MFIGDGYDYVMNLTSEKYDMIILDAFMDLSQVSNLSESTSEFNDVSGKNALFN